MQTTDLIPPPSNLRTIPHSVAKWMIKNTLFIQNLLRIKEGTNKMMGVATLVAGTVVVANTLVAANSRIFLTGQNTSGAAGFLYVSARVVGTSFTILSSNAGDTRDVAWMIVNPYT